MGGDATAPQNKKQKTRKKDHHDKQEVEQN